MKGSTLASLTIVIAVVLVLVFGCILAERPANAFNSPILSPGVTASPPASPTAPVGQTPTSTVTCAQPGTPYVVAGPGLTVNTLQTGVITFFVAEGFNAFAPSPTAASFKQWSPAQVIAVWVGNTPTDMTKVSVKVTSPNGEATSLTLTPENVITYQQLTGTNRFLMGARVTIQTTPEMFAPTGPFTVAITYPNGGNLPTTATATGSITGSCETPPASTPAATGTIPAPTVSPTTSVTVTVVPTVATATTIPPMVQPSFTYTETNGVVTVTELSDNKYRWWTFGDVVVDAGQMALWKNTYDPKVKSHPYVNPGQYVIRMYYCAGLWEYMFGPWPPPFVQQTITVVNGVEKPFATPQPPPPPMPTFTPPPVTPAITMTPIVTATLIISPTASPSVEVPGRCTVYASPPGMGDDAALQAAMQAAVKLSQNIIVERIFVYYDPPTPVANRYTWRLEQIGPNGITEIPAPAPEPYVIKKPNEGGISWLTTCRSTNGIPSAAQIAFQAGVAKQIDLLEIKYPGGIDSIPGWRLQLNQQIAGLVGPENLSIAAHKARNWWGDMLRTKEIEAQYGPLMQPERDRASAVRTWLQFIFDHIGHWQ
jgi:hypothetical protein